MVKAASVVLVVDDDRAVAESHARMLGGAGFAAVTESDPCRVEEDLDRRPDIDLVLLDVRMPVVNGLELLPRIKFRRPQIGVVMATVVNDIEEAVKATKAGAYNYLLKPLQTERLKAVLDSFFANRPGSLAGDPRFASFITGDPAFEPVFRRIAAFAGADVTVLIQGETGTGKELAAHLSHALSPRSRERFMAVNVASLSPHLFESELFGHRRGAFTGAVQDHQGYFEEVGTGTLFLDEIGELGMEQQKRLLRVLQTGRYARLGETEERPIRARVVLATNRDLKRDLAEGRFREDLYYRLAAHGVVLPPLRERRGDTALLAGYFLRKYCSQFGREISGFHPDAMALLSRYRMPGNVRELEGIVSSAVLLEQTDLVQAETLPDHLHGEPAGEDLKSQRYRAIMEALAACGGNQTQAAERLGIARGTLNRLLKEFRERGVPAS